MTSFANDLLAARSEGQWQVRLATHHDAESFADIHVRSWQAAYPGFVPQQQLDALDIGAKIITWRAMLRQPSTDNYRIVCEYNQRIIGWCTYGSFRQDDMFPSLDNTAREDAARGAGEIHGMYADPDYWGVGAGYRLLNQALLDLDAQYATSYLWVFDGNLRAHTCYERAGFRKHLTSVNSKPGLSPRTLMRRTMENPPAA